MSAGPLALVGSGEFLPAMEEVDRHLLAGRASKVVFLPTAAAEEGPASIRYWTDLGAGHYRRLEVEAEALPVLDRAGADNPVMAAAVEGAGLIYLSGGNPGYLARTLRDSLVWGAIRDAWEGGAALAGCSAGAVALGPSVVDVRRARRDAVPALGAVPHLTVIPHFDRLAAWRPGLIEAILAARPPDVTVIGVDEDTAIVGGPHEWTVWGRQKAWIIHSAGQREGFAAGDTLTV